MGKDRCVVGVCDNDKRYLDHFIKHNNVTEKLILHKLPADPRKIEDSIHAVRKGRKYFVVPKNCFVCSNHFVDGKPTKIVKSQHCFLL